MQYLSYGVNLISTLSLFHKSHTDPLYYHVQILYSLVVNLSRGVFHPRLETYLFFKYFRITSLVALSTKTYPSAAD